MSERAGFIEAIIRDPDEDTHRLVFADWLDDKAGTVPCPRCAHLPPEQREQFRRGGFSGRDMCMACEDALAVPDGSAGRAEFIRSQVAAANGEDIGSMKLWDLLYHSEQWFVDVCKMMHFEWIDWGVMHNGAVHYENKYAPGEFYVRRGFVSEIRCRATDWLAHADALCWHPGQTVECPECKGEGAVAVTGRASAYLMSSLCMECRDGRAPRPCPETAHPIRRVVLTDITDDPDQFLIDNKFAVVHRDGKTVWSSEKWPGIDFELPPPSPADIGPSPIGELMRAHATAAAMGFTLSQSAAREILGLDPPCDACGGTGWADNRTGDERMYCIPCHGRGRARHIATTTAPVT